MPPSGSQTGAEWGGEAGIAVYVAIMLHEYCTVLVNATNIRYWY